jgi:hypothetical protein
MLTSNLAIADYFWAWASVIISVQKRFPQHKQQIAYIVSIHAFVGVGRARLRLVAAAPQSRTNFAVLMR